MKDSGSIHQKVQEHCDCFVTADPLKEMSKVKQDADAGEAAVKWLALAALHGLNNNAEEIEITRSADGTTRVTVEYRDTELPSPGPDVGAAIIEAVRGMTHIEGRKGKTALALGVRDSSVELKVKVKQKDGGDRVSIEFP